MKKVLASLMAALMVLVLAMVPALATAPSGEPIKIGLATVLTGERAMEGEYASNAAAIITQEINDAGGVLAAVDYVTPNETELHILTGMETETNKQVETAARKLLERDVRAVVAKLGERGAMLVTQKETVLLPGYRVKAVDTTAAGDSFDAGLAVALLDNANPVDAVRFANATAALSTTAMGAQAAMPTRGQVAALMQAE